MIEDLLGASSVQERGTKQDNKQEEDANWHDDSHYICNIHHRYNNTNWQNCLKLKLLSKITCRYYW